LKNRYKAFISYSHSDETWARWLHRKLERYRLPRSVRHGAQVGGGELRPIFRDRDELASSGNLDAAILDALQRSDALIVICSPAAAKSRWVNQEILEFCRVQPADRVFCCIVEGDPPGVFPEALAVLGEPLAADFRKTRDGRRDGLTKLVAGSWLGTASSRRGDLAAALDYQAQSRVAREALASEHADNLHLQLWKAVAQANEASAHAMLGRIAEAETQYALAQKTVQDLLDSDPGNQQWRRFLLSSTVDRTELALHPSYSPLAGFDVSTGLRKAIEGLIQLREAEPMDRRVALALLKAYRIRLALERDHDRPEAAALASGARELAAAQYERGSVDPLMESEIYQLLVLSQVRQLPGNPRRDKLATDVRDRARRSDFPRLLDALARDLAFSGNADAEAIRARLSSMGYQPLQPWPSTDGK